MSAVHVPSFSDRFTTTHRPHRGGVVLTLGILGFFVAGLILGPVAWCLGTSDLRAMERGEMDEAGRSLTEAGRICGIVVTFINVIAIGVGFGLLVVFLAAMALGGL